MIIHGKYECSDVLKALEELQCEILEYEEGTLIDNMMFTNGEKTFVVLETYQNCWSSCYTLYEGTMEEMYTLWEKCVA